MPDPVEKRRKGRLYDASNPDLDLGWSLNPERLEVWHYRVEEDRLHL